MTALLMTERRSSSVGVTGIGIPRPSFGLTRLLSPSSLSPPSDMLRSLVPRLRLSRLDSTSFLDISFWK